MTSQEDVKRFRTNGSWRHLSEKALGYLASAQQRYPVEIQWALGGGTRLMLEFCHRISDDIDIFVADSAIKGLLSPAFNDAIATDVSGYSDDHSALKLYFKDLGEIDFIFRPPLLDGANELYELDRRIVLEPVAEVMAKKLYFRGDRLTPRDLFDWWYVGSRHSHMIPDLLIAEALRSKLDGIQLALQSLYSQRLDQADSVWSPMAIWPRIRSPFLPEIGEAVDWANDRLVRFRTLVDPPTIDPSK
ncbi:MAG: nucleotidyl transferase AbiEii/AbiGii toxin family protein [Ahniella sp.]|nr:nucleotidyl transferase AbiEii/AbiGii toxin family protein [Ahniella sp.]